MTDQNKSVLEGIRELTSHIIARAAEIEAARRIPLDIVQSLKCAEMSSSIGRLSTQTVKGT
jgi:hypothetical protein